MDNSGGIQASLAGRYAFALFTLARDEKKLPVVEKSLGNVKAALDESPDFASLASNAVVSRDQASQIVAAISKTLKLDTLSANMLGVLAQNGRLSQLANVIRAFNTLAAHHRGEISAEVTSAFPLSASQLDDIRKQLKDRAGRSINITAKVDPAILGGLVVKMGSQMIDSSIKTRLNTLSQAMKG